MVEQRHQSSTAPAKNDENVLGPSIPSPQASRHYENHLVIGNGSLNPTGIFDQVEDYAIMILDQKGAITTWNRGAKKIKGYSASEIIGKNYRIFYTKEDKENNLSEQMLAEAAQKGRTSYEGWRVRKDGRRFWGSITLTAIHTETGSIKGYLKVTRDLTEKKIAEEQLSNFVEELKLKNEELRKSEERYHKMVSEVLDYAIILLDPEGNILDWNKGAEKLKGYSAKEIVGKNFRLFYPREEKESGLPEHLLNEALRNGSVNHEGWRINKQGKRFWGGVTITALHDDNGKVIGFTKLTRDLTERKIAEDQLSNVMEELRQINDQLKASEERYHKMIEEVRDYAIILLDKQGHIENWNAGAAFIKGYSATEIIGRHFSIFYPPEAQQNNLPGKLLGEAQKNGRVAHEGWRVKKDGTLFWGSVVITALHNDRNEVIGFSKVTRDLTERKKAEDALKKTAEELNLKNKALERLNAELSSFTYVASHDLKEPLRKIQTFALRIEEMGFAEEKSKLFLNKIKDSAARMQNLIDSLLSYSRISNDERVFENVDLNDILGAVKADLEIAIQEKRAILLHDPLPIVRGVAYQLHQLFLNLISNSIKFSKPEEAPCIQITLKVVNGKDVEGASFSVEKKYYHIALQDNGIGFSMAFSNKIFEAFQRLNPVHTFAGTGIGLAIVKKIVENHAGFISAEAVPGVGATFHLYLPAESAGKN